MGNYTEKGFIVISLIIVLMIVSIHYYLKHIVIDNPAPELLITIPFLLIAIYSVHKKLR